MEFTISSVPRTHSVFLAALQAADLHYLRELRTRTVFPHERVEVLGAAEFARRLPGCALCVSERYHGLIAAMLARVPYVGIGDDPKIISFCKETGMPYFVRDALHEATAEDLLARAQAAYNQERLDAVAAAYRQRQQQQRELVASLIRELEPSATTAD